LFCNAGRSKLAFNWNLIQAPHAVIDYVDIHELCQIIQPNHSKFFWKEVEQLSWLQRAQFMVEEICH
tara:strand:+ start:333 stop:533 length:201 start_codon:yes stop_codon:yes gene_type:complete